MNKIDIKSLSREELVRELAGLRIERYRIDQIYRWLYKEGVKSFDDMRDLPSNLREGIKKKFHIIHHAVLDKKVSAADGTTKFLFKLEDGNSIETVYLPEDDRVTLCLSTQVGCKFKCAFCASSPHGFIRNLSCSEILEEVISVRREHPDKNITNIVFMGIGEPFDNYDNLMRSIRILNDKRAFNIGARRITISTCGLVPGIKMLEGENLQVELSVSLHSPTDEVRSKIVPVNKRYPIKELMDTCREYTARTGRVITFEYVLLNNTNASVDDARSLAALLDGMKCKVNVIAYNQVKQRGFEKPSDPEIGAFMNVLRRERVNATRRKSKGEDIDAGCGQLRIAKMREDDGT